MLRPEEAWGRLAGRVPAPATERVARRAALGRCLAGSVRAGVDVPAADVSAMDGFALAGPPAAGHTLEIAGSVAAGEAPGMAMPAGRAVRIMTGAPIPRGAERVIPVELCEVSEGAVVVRRDVEPGANIRRRGEIHRAGDPLLEPGALLTAGALALLATHGHGDIEVNRRPGVSILTTGDEVVPADAHPEPGQLRDSHTDFLLAACATLGIEARSHGVAPDEAAALRARLERTLDSEVALVTGGVSMGSHDLVEAALVELGCEILCDAVAMQPGKPLVLAAHPRGLVFGLPGNPASAMVAFWLFARPALRRMLGFADGFWQGALGGVLDAGLPAARDRDRFLPAAVRFTQGRLRVRPIPPRGSHDLGAFARGSALVRVPAGQEPRAPGDSCEILPFVNWIDAG